MVFKRILLIVYGVIFFNLAGCQSTLVRHDTQALLSRIGPAKNTIGHQDTNAGREIRIHRTIDAPLASVWEVLADYEDVHKFVGSIKDSKHIGGPTLGVGAVRQCTVAMGMKVTEEVAVWNEGQQLVINMHSAMPVTDHQADFRLEEYSRTQTSLTFVMRYSTRAGVAGRAMNAVFLERMMKRSMTELLDGLESYVSGN